MLSSTLVRGSEKVGSSPDAFSVTCGIARHNGYIYMRFGKYRIVIFNKNKTIVTATAS